VEIGGVARQAKGLWMSQVARNLSDAAEGFLISKRYLIHDRGPLFTAEFLEILQASGVPSVKPVPRSPNLAVSVQPSAVGPWSEGEPQLPNSSLFGNSPASVADWNRLAISWHRRAMPEWCHGGCRSK